MSDLIDRQAVIEALSMNMPKLTTPDGCGQFDHEIEIADEAFVDCMRIIDDLPSAEPVRHGKWIKADSQQYFRKHYPCFTCSECGYRKDSQKTWNYCPNCGARMDGERKEE